MCTCQEQLDENERRIESSAQVLGRDETPDSQRRSPDESEHQPGVRPVSDQSHAVLPVGRIVERAAMTALQGQPRGRKKLRPSEEALLTEVQRLREVIAELSSENLQLKKGRWR